MNDSELKSKLNSIIEHFRSEITGIRTGRAEASLVEGILVEAYGAKMKIMELGTISVLDPSMILISPWDKTLIKEICQAIVASGLSLNPVPDSQTVKVPIPALTEDRRKEFAKLVTEKSEVAKNSVRNVRQDAMKDIDNQFADKEITEDDKFSSKEEIEKTVKGFTEQIDDIAERKKNELMTV
ncbi:ribosome recycling factor [candidate division WWE3 bacterium RIFCSPHIGHO2_01_FULL_40_23]|nr:MAG: ribosome recycling factor [candidate division WWE3 bacterium RIFCSPHIGHO2_01_FULL_40_23]